MARGKRRKTQHTSSCLTLSVSPTSPSRLLLYWRHWQSSGPRGEGPACPEFSAGPGHPCKYPALSWVPLPQAHSPEPAWHRSPPTSALLSDPGFCQFDPGPHIIGKIKFKEGEQTNRFVKRGNSEAERNDGRTFPFLKNYGFNWSLDYFRLPCPFDSVMRRKFSHQMTISSSVWEEKPGPAGRLLRT